MVRVLKIFLFALIPILGSAQNGGLRLSGVNSGVYSVNKIDLLNESKTFTFSSWIKPSSSQNRGAILFDYNHTGLSNFVVKQDGTNNINDYHIIFWGGSSWKTAKPVTLKANEWSHFAIVLGESYLYYYVDANQVDSILLPPSPEKTIKNIPSSIGIGGLAYNQIGNFRGEVDDVTVWNTELSIDEISLIIEDHNYKKELQTLRLDFNSKQEIGFVYKGASLTTKGAPTGESGLLMKRKQVKSYHLPTGEVSIEVISDASRNDFLYCYEFTNVKSLSQSSIVENIYPKVCGIYEKGNVEYNFTMELKEEKIDDLVLMQRKEGNSYWEIVKNAVYNEESKTIEVNNLKSSFEFTLGKLKVESDYLIPMLPLDNKYANVDDGVVFQWRSSVEECQLFFGTNNPPNNIVNGALVSNEIYEFKENIDVEKTHYWQLKSNSGISEVFSFIPCKSDGEVVINEILAINSWSSYDPDYSVSSDWIELKNNSQYPLDLKDYYLADNKSKWELPGDSVIMPNEYLIFWADGENYKNHTNFKLNDNSETVKLYKNSTVVDSVNYSNQFQDISFGRDNKNQWKYFSTPTPNKGNNKGSSGSRSNKIEFSSLSGFYKQKFELTLSAKNGASIYYTTNGSIPSINSDKFIKPILIEKSVVVKSIAIEPDKLPSEVGVSSYFINEEFSLPVFSMSTNDEFLNGKTLGIFENTKNDWERTANMEYFDKTGKRVVNQNVGIKLNGWGIRNFPMKPLSVFARKKYGKSTIDYKFFHNREINTFSNLILRNGGNDITQTKIRDGLMQILVDDINIDNQAFQPAIIFWNGEYYGIINIREKINEQYLKAYHDVNVKKIDMIEPILRGEGFAVVNGTLNKYTLLEKYIENNNIKNDEVYNYVTSKIDIDEYINYQISEIYFSNLDWIGNNIKFWKEQKDSAKWRWILFDTDFGFGMFDYSDSDQNLLETASTDKGTQWPNPPFSTFLFRNLLKNEQFKNEFSQRFLIYLNTIFTPTRVIHVIDSLESIYTKEMPRQVYRWGAVKTMENWHKQVAKLREFAKKRPAYCVQHLTEKFSLPEPITFNYTSTEGGSILLSGAELKQSEYNGQIFKNTPIVLTAIPLPGYQFSAWEGIESLRYKILSSTADDLILLLIITALTFILGVVIMKLVKQQMIKSIIIGVILAGVTASFLIFLLGFKINSNINKDELQVILQQSGGNVRAVFVKE